MSEQKSPGPAPGRLSLSVAEAPNSPDAGHVNTSPRAVSKKKKTGWGLFSSSHKKDRDSIGSETDIETVDDKNAIIMSLHNELVQKDALIDALKVKVDQLEAEITKTSSDIIKRRHPLNKTTNMITDDGTVTQKMVASRGSIATTNVLRALPDVGVSATMQLAHKFSDCFKNPVDYIDYLQSKEFANDLIDMCDAMCELLEEEPRCHFLQSPVYVFGDIHGNLEDLHFFADNLWKSGMGLTAGKFMFLGDYVDRGLNCLECIAYLFGLKVLYPGKLVLLRGNHETRSVNGWEEHYHEKSFLYQCKARFGQALGEQVWEECNQVFDRLPLSGVIDHDIFCIHGGIPRPIPGQDNAIQAILATPNVAAVNPCYEHETEFTQQIASDCIWSDPASNEQEKNLDANGFGPSLRGGDCVCFGTQAIDNFLQQNSLSFIIRAHEAHAHGVSLSKAAKVFTVFSTSKDHGQGKKAMAGCILVDTDKIQVINRSPHYKNKYIHHRTSVASNLTDDQLREMSRLGLVRADSLDARKSHKGRSKRHLLKAESIAEDSKEEDEEKTTTHVVAFNNI